MKKIRLIDLSESNENERGNKLNNIYSNYALTNTVMIKSRDFRNKIMCTI